jgi:hypothetical protein
MNVQTRPQFLLLSIFALALASFASVPARASDVTLTVTAVAKKGTPPPVKKDDVQVFEGKEHIQVADWRHDRPLYLAILIDDSIDTEAASQWSDLKAFINEQPPNTVVAVAYARNGAAMIAQDFTNDHA